MATKAESFELTRVNTRLFAADVSQLKKIAEKNGGEWQVELRQLVRRALKGERREIAVLSERR
jgi:hypothetical protein